MTALLEADTLVMNQKAKLVELTNQYEIHGSDGAELGYVQQEGQGSLRKTLRFVSSVDQFLTHRLSIYDSTHAKVLELTRPAKLLKSRITVEDGHGRKVGAIVQQNVLGKIRFKLVGVHGERLGEIRAENWRAWDFSIIDRNETEVGRIDKKFVGVTKAVFTTADNYVVYLDTQLEGGLRLLAIAAAVAVDTALKQDARGIDISDIADFV